MQPRTRGGFRDHFGHSHINVPAVTATPNVQGFDGAVMSFVEYLYELAR